MGAGSNSIEHGRNQSDRYVVYVTSQVGDTIIRSFGIDQKD